MPVSRSTLFQAPNLLTLGRVGLVPFFVAAFWLPAPALHWVTFGLFAVAGATDWLDGRLARRKGLVSDFGRFLDPVADKILVAAALVMLAATDRLSDAGSHRGADYPGARAGRLRPAGISGRQRLSCR